MLVVHVGGGGGGGGGRVGYLFDGYFHIHTKNECSKRRNCNEKTANGLAQEVLEGLAVGMFPLTLTVLNRDYHRGYYNPY